MTDAEITALREAALKATQGKWQAERIWTGDYEIGVGNHARPTEWTQIAALRQNISGLVQKPIEANARYIALASPQTMLALLDELKALRDALKAIATFQILHAPDESMKHIRSVAQAALKEGASHDPE